MIVKIAWANRFGKLEIIISIFGCTPSRRAIGAPKKTSHNMAYLANSSDQDKLSLRTYRKKTLAETIAAIASTRNIAHHRNALSCTILIADKNRISVVMLSSCSYYFLFTQKKPLFLCSAISWLLDLVLCLFRFHRVI